VCFQTQYVSVFSHLKTLEWVDAGHWLHSEKPEEVITLVNEFLSAGHGTRSKTRR
jgi:pimeloyl-ACP methyl ester carboxylesterase